MSIIETILEISALILIGILFLALALAPIILEDREKKKE